MYLNSVVRMQRPQAELMRHHGPSFSGRNVIHRLILLCPRRRQCRRWFNDSRLMATTEINRMTADADPSHTNDA